LNPFYCLTLNIIKPSYHHTIESSYSLANINAITEEELEEFEEEEDDE